MAGSLNHIIADDGTFTKEFVECGTGDCTEALAECHQIIAELLETVVKNSSGSLPVAAAMGDKREVLRLVCDRLGFPVPTVEEATIVDFKPDEIVVPVIQPDLHGAESVYKPDAPLDYLIWSNEHGAWWGPNHVGYVGLIEQAGRYTKAEADGICAQANHPDNTFKRGSKINEMAVKAPEAS